MNLEKRVFIANAELRAESDFVVTGKAVSYNKLSPDNQLGEGMREKVAPGTFADSIRQGGFQGDVICTVNHSNDRVLGRLSNGTLTINDTPEALRFRCQLDKNNPDHVAAHASIKRGDLYQCSFAFMNPQSDWIEEKDEEGNPCTTRVIKKADLLDVSIVARPFYSNPGSTDAQARAAEARSKNGKLGRWSAETIERWRKVTRSMTPKLFVRDGASGADGGDEMALVRAHLEQSHQMLESAFASSDTARQLMDCWGWDDDDDPDDSRSKRAQKGSPYAPYGDPDDLRCFRELHQKAHAAMEECCKQMARCRLSQPMKGK